MSDFSGFIKAAHWLSDQELNLYPLLQTEELLTEEQIGELLRTASGLRTGNPELLRRCIENGMEPDQLFLRIASCPEDAFAPFWGKCRFVAETRQDVRRLDEIAPQFLRPGYLETIAIDLRNSGESDQFAADRIPQFSRWIRMSQCLAVRGIFADCGGEGDLCEAAKARFSLIKKIRSDMPCLFSYFCLNGLLPPLAQGDEGLMNTLKMLASLNDTSFYARFYIQ